MRRIPNCVPNRWTGCLPRRSWGVGCSCESTLARVLMAIALIAQVIARTRALPLFLTDGWKAYTVALLQVIGVVYRQRRRGKVGRKPKPRWVALQTLFYAQMIKVHNMGGLVAGGSGRV